MFQYLKKTYLLPYVCLIFTGILYFACRKTFLDKQPLGQVGEASLANKRGVEGLLIGAYSLLDGIGSNQGNVGSACSNWIYGSICGSEAYKGSDAFDHPDITPIEIFDPTAENPYLLQKWSTVYDGVQRANDVLRILPKAKDISEADQKRIAAEARFLRAHYHFEAKKMWGNVPFVDETISYENRNYHVSNVEKDIWPDIENDLLYAVDNLPETQEQPGRINKYIAMALLAKAYMFQAYKIPAKFTEAKLWLEEIISSGKYWLIDYHQNFNIESKNNKESIFSVQMSVNDGATQATSSAYNNGNFGDLLNFPDGFLYGLQPGLCCGFFAPSQYLVNHFKTDPATGLPDFLHFNDEDVTRDTMPSNEPFTPYPGSLDPRLDWTVGRRGIPFLDWGDHPGQDWARHPYIYGHYSPKKNSYYKSQQLTYTDNTFWSTGTTANNVNLIRYAEILLWAAEVAIETDELTKARSYVNEVRRRANTSERVKKPDGTPAANYKVGEYTDPWTDKEFARNAVRYERVLELGMEGHRFFDLVRWGVADIEITKYLDKEKTLRIHLRNAAFKKDENEYFPIPQVEIDLSGGKMIQNQGYP